MDELLIGEQKYISSKRAAEITGYAKDYIGQLCREGRVEARLVGRGWYVREAAIRDHRFGAEKAPVAAEEVKAVGESTPEITIEQKYVSDEPATPVQHVEEWKPFDTAIQMQEAWQEWFSKNKVEEPAAPVEIQKIEEETAQQGEIPHEVEVGTVITLEKIADEPSTEVDTNQGVEEQNIESQSSREVVKELVKQTYLVSSRSISNQVFTYALVIVGAIALGVGVIGSGLVELKGAGFTASAVQYLSGTTVLSR